VQVCAIESPDDGLAFLPDSVQVEAIREDQEYGGMRIKLMAMLGNVRIPLQADVGAGDAVVPPPEVLDYPGLLDLPRARLHAYRPETPIAEKTEAMVRLALANSRMKDFFDIHRLVETRTFDGDTMRLAVAATFTRRGIEIPGERRLALTNEFAEDAQRKVQWAAFVRRARRPELADLSAIIATLDRFLWPVLQASARGEPWPHLWSNGAWKELSRRFAEPNSTVTSPRSSASVMKRAPRAWRRPLKVKPFAESSERWASGARERSGLSRSGLCYQCHL
jgi:Nucleotidyl transferase AbiEii toxin, Type IV TA system